VDGGTFEKILYASIYLVAVVLLIGGGIWFALWLRARFRDSEDPAGIDHAMLSQIGDLHREGGLSDEEYRSIKGRLVERIDESLRGRQARESSRGDP
jgi:hypothetical protein